MAGASGGVIFDADGTLLDTNYLHIAAWWEAFRERGYDIRCADEEVDLMLDALGARDTIATVVSSGAVERTKPEPDIVEKALSDSGTDRTRAVMVGDSVWDVIAVYADPAALLDDLKGSPIGHL